MTKNALAVFIIFSLSVPACLQQYYHDHLLRDEIGKVISVEVNENKACAIVKIKVKAATGTKYIQ